MSAAFEFSQKANSSWNKWTKKFKTSNIVFDGRKNTNFRSSHGRCAVKKVFLCKFHRKNLCWSLFNKVGPYLRNILAYISGTKIFQIWDLWRNTANNINFHYRTNSVTVDDKIFQYIQNTIFLVHFSSFWGKKFFSAKFSCHAQLHMGF